MPTASPLAFFGVRILTVDPGRPEPEALVVADGRVAAVGDREIVDRWPGAEVVNGGRILVPGFIDAHNHLCLAALHPRWADLSATTNVDDLARALEARRGCGAHPSSPPFDGDDNRLRVRQARRRSQTGQRPDGVGRRG